MSTILDVCLPVCSSYAVRPLRLIRSWDMLELLFYMAAEILGKEYVSLWCVLWYIFLCFDVDVIVIHMCLLITIFLVMA